MYCGQGAEKVTKYLIASAMDLIDCDPALWNGILSDFDEMAHGFVIDRSGKEWGGVLLFAKADEEVKVNKWGMTSYNGVDEVLDSNHKASIVKVVEN